MPRRELAGLDEASLNRLEGTRLGVARHPIRDMALSLHKCFVEKADDEESLLDLFTQYATACRFLDEFRKETFLIIQRHKKIGRNHPCPCGSEKKWKHCHGI